jgi:hypothetical protein
MYAIDNRSDSPTQVAYILYAYLGWQQKHELVTVSCLQMTSHGKRSIRCSTKQRHKQSQV